MIQLSLVFQIGAIVFGGIAPLLLSAVNLPYIREYARPSEFETAWDQLNVSRRLNHKDDGFNEVLGFLMDLPTQAGPFIQWVVADLDIDESEVIPDDGRPAVEELRLSTRPKDFSESILLCYDENTEGPIGEGYTPQRIDAPTIPSPDASGDDWRWMAQITGLERTAARYVEAETRKWKVYGSIAVSLSVVCQVLAIAV